MTRSGRCRMRKETPLAISSVSGRCGTLETCFATEARSSSLDMALFKRSWTVGWSFSEDWRRDESPTCGYGV